MKMTPASWQSDCTAMATPEDEPPVIMIAPSFSIMRLADARAASDLVCVSPVTIGDLLAVDAVAGQGLRREGVQHAAVAFTVQVLRRRAAAPP
jgi:hypothetical protein